MKRIVSFTAFLLCVLMILPSLVSCGVPGQIIDLINRHPAADREVKVSVMLALGDGAAVVGDNPIRVAPGENAVFEIRLQDGMRMELPDREDVEYENGVLTVYDVKKPLTLNLPTRIAYNFNFSFSEGVSASKMAGEYPEGTKIKLFADEKKGEQVFIGFSNGATLEEGGTLLSNDSNCEIVLSRETEVYANYAAEGAMILVYHANGGKTAGGSNTMYVEVRDSVYICPNTLASQGQFTREGYVLGGYNTEPDGSGRYYGCGWNVVMPENNIAELYAVWIKETDASAFTYTKTSKAVTITKYTGDEETVVIPEKIGGIPVTNVAVGAFTNSSFKTLYITRNVINVQNGALKNCENFTTLYLYDSVIKIADAAFSGCPNFSTLFLQAVMNPKYISGRNGTYQMKYERLMTAASPKLVIHAGSNVAYGIDSALLEDELGHRYNVVNYGCNQGTPANFYLEVIAYWAKPGDILIHAPEGFKNYQYGYNEMNTTTWQIFEGAFDAFSCVDLRHLIKFFDSFSAFQSARVGRADQTYEHYTSETVNQYGDYIALKVGQKYTPGNKIYDFNPSVYTAAYAANINLAYDLCREKGMKVWHSFGVVNKVALKDASLTAAVQEKFENEMKTALKFDAFISRVSTYIMDNKYFYNSDFHLTTEGSQIRTRNLAKDILAQLAREGIK